MQELQIKSQNLICNYCRGPSIGEAVVCEVCDCVHYCGEKCLKADATDHARYCHAGLKDKLYEEGAHITTIATHEYFGRIAAYALHMWSQQGPCHAIFNFRILTGNEKLSYGRLIGYSEYIYQGILQRVEGLSTQPHLRGDHLYVGIPLLAVDKIEYVGWSIEGCAYANELMKGQYEKVGDGFFITLNNAGSLMAQPTQKRQI